MQLPVLHLCVRGVPSLLMVNGTLAGESENEPVIPVSPDGKAFVTCLPFAKDEKGAVVLPQTVALTFEQGVLCTPVEGCTAYLEADGLTHIELNPVVVPLQHEAAMPVALSKASTQWRGHAVFATLMREENVYIAIEDRNHNRLALLYDIADMTEGKCQAVRCLTESDFLVTGQGAKGPRAILCTPADNGGYQIAADEYASAEATPGALLCTKECGDICAHQARYTIAIAAGEPAASAPTYGYFTHKRKEPTDAQQAVSYTHLHPDVDHVFDQVVRIVCRPGLLEHGFLYAKALVHLLGKVRGKRPQNEDKLLGDIHQERHVCGIATIDVFIHGVDQFHNARDGGVKHEPFDIVRDALQGGGKDVSEFLFRLAIRCAGTGLRLCCAFTDVLNQPFYTLKETSDGLNAVIVPCAAFYIIEAKHQICAEDVRAIDLNIVIGRSDIAAGFAHLFAVRTEDDALIDQTFKGFIKMQKPHIAQRFGKEARI